MVLGVFMDNKYSWCVDLALSDKLAYGLKETDRIILRSVEEKEKYFIGLYVGG